MNGANPILSIDEFSKIRILEASQFEASEKLKEECRDFTSKINDFNEIVGGILDMMQQKARQIEAEKLKVIGLRNQVEGEVEARKSKQTELQTLIKEKQAELDRLAAQADSLVKVQNEQQTLIETLSFK
ncbi:intraflagellar transport protein 20 [Polychytrium aggregatum]|uniref:intraflagellar transport protein 20 n=1 Tax=Polychytrium aggregatum TaxID=110093 RepID=UPI0022FE8BC6|nr:intraflagellar transport protein 20 [Polychytrium aggregatum]KAI9206893.1 intraflagellar transport protein 20 [Polychytrium aggregatum]